MSIISRLFSRAPIVVDTAPPPLPSLGPQKPVRAFVNASTSTVARVLNTSFDSVNTTVRNASQHFAAGANKTVKAISNATASAATAVENTATSSTATSSVPWYEDLEKMTTTSVSERASSLSLAHMFAWFLLFATLTMTTVVLLNWCLRSSQSAAEDEEAEEDDEEMPTKAFVLPSSSSTQGTLAEGTNSASSSSNRLLASRGNLARQQFLESRKTGGAAKNYGSTATA